MEIAAWTGAILSIAAVFGLLARIALTTWRGIRRVSRFLDDWFGSPERPGVPAQPGVMERVAATEDGVADLREDVHGIKTYVGMEGT